MVVNFNSIGELSFYLVLLSLLDKRLDNVNNYRQKVGSLFKIIDIGLRRVLCVGVCESRVVNRKSGGA